MDLQVIMEGIFSHRLLPSSYFIIFLGGVRRNQMRRRTFGRTPLFFIIFFLSLYKNLGAKRATFSGALRSNTGKDDIAISEVYKFLPRSKSCGMLKRYALLSTTCTKKLSFKIPYVKNLNFKQMKGKKLAKMFLEKVCKTSHTNYFLYYLFLSSCESCIQSALLQQLMKGPTIFILVYQLDW